MAKQNKNTKRTSAPTVQRISKEEFNKLRKRSIRNKVIAGVCTFIVDAGVGAGAYYGISDCWLNKDVPTPPAIEQGQGQTEEIKHININTKDYIVSKEEIINVGGVPGFRIDSSTIEESVNYNIPFNIIFIDKNTHQSIISIESLSISLHKVNDASLGKEFYFMFLNLDSLLKFNKINVLYKSSGMSQVISFANYDFFSGFCHCKKFEAEGKYFVFDLLINSGTINDVDSINLYFEIDI